MIIALAEVEGAAERGVAFGVVLNRRNMDVLDEIDRVVLMVVGGHAEQNGQLVFVSGEFLEGNIDFIAGMEPEIEAQHGFGWSNRAWQILANVLRFQHGEVGVHHVERRRRPFRRAGI